jgi:hypothetical protein
MVSAALVVLAATGLVAQTRPDFSGRWTTDPDPAAADAGAAGRGAGRAGGARGGGRGRGGDMGSGWGTTITLTQDARQLTVEYAFFTRGDMQPPLKFVFALDGSETTNSVFMGRGRQSQKSRAAWDGSTLVITTTHDFVDPATNKPQAVDVVQRLSLESPSSLVVETTRASIVGAPSTSTRSTYRKIS